MNSVLNSIIVKVQKQLNCESNEADCAIIRNITRNLSTKSHGELKMILMIMAFDEIIEKFG